MKIHSYFSYKVRVIYCRNTSSFFFKLLTFLSWDNFFFYIVPGKREFPLLALPEPLTLSVRKIKKESKSSDYFSGAHQTVVLWILDTTIPSVQGPIKSAAYTLDEGQRSLARGWGVHACWQSPKWKYFAFVSDIVEARKRVHGSRHESRAPCMSVDFGFFRGEERERRVRSEQISLLLRTIHHHWCCYCSSAF